MRVNSGRWSGKVTFQIGKSAGLLRQKAQGIFMKCPTIQFGWRIEFGQERAKKSGYKAGSGL